MASQNPGPAPAAKPKVPASSNEAGYSNDVKMERSSEQPSDVQGQETEDWNSERRLVSALATLQEMEAKAQQLRTLVPDRLLGPLRPVVAQDKESLPKSPPALLEHLTQTARDGISEVDTFRSTWNQPEMRAIWDRVDLRLKESGDNRPQPMFVWKNDYRMMLRKLDHEEERRKERAKLETQQGERDRLASIQGGWKGIVESFTAAARPGLTIDILSSTEDTAQFAALLHNTSTLFMARNPDVQKAGDWEVTLKSQGATSKTTDGMLHCINNRDRKWDLQYLLDMFASYVDVKKTPCINCNKLLDSNAQLPTIRKPKSLQPKDEKSADQKGSLTWEPYHPRCL